LKKLVKLRENSGTIRAGRLAKEQEREIIIRPEGGLNRYWRDFWQYRDLLSFLTWRDVLARYKQTVLGVAWSLIRPIVTMVVFTLVFGKLAGLPSGDAPYPVLVYAALLPWQFFSVSVSESGNSLVNNANLITKVYFPRLIIPIGALAVGLVDFLVSVVVYAGLMAYYGFLPDWRIATVPLFLLLAIGVSLGFGLWFAALMVKYRDFRHILPFLVQVGLFLSPVGFNSAIVPEKWRILYSLNPMVGVIDGFRWALLRGTTPLYLPGVFLSVGLTSIVLWGGIRYFRRTEQAFADVI